MTVGASRPTQIVWATRGRRWGFRFLLDAGLDDPLPTYNRMFDDMTETTTAFRRDGVAAAVRFPDPEGRRDSAGRVIPHEFIVLDDTTGAVDSVNAGVSLVWPLVSGIFSKVWEAEKSPSKEEIESAW